MDAVRTAEECQDEIERVKFLLGTYKIDLKLHAIFQLINKKVILIQCHSFEAIAFAAQSNFTIAATDRLMNLETVCQRNRHRVLIASFFRLKNHCDPTGSQLRKQNEAARWKRRVLKGNKDKSGSCSSKTREQKRCYLNQEKREELDENIKRVRSKIQAVVKSFREFMSAVEGRAGPEENSKY